MRIAIIHDYLNQYGGAERVLEEFMRVWPQAPVFVAIYDRKKMPARYANWDIRTSPLNRIPFATKIHKALILQYPQAFESFDLSEYDVILSSSSGFAHGVLTGPDTLNLCYLHSPPRFLWSYHKYARDESLGPIARAVVERSLSALRIWDRLAAERTHRWISTSKVIQQRLQHIYKKNSVIIPPPVDTRRFEKGHGPGKHFLLLMRLVGWKRPDIAIKACTQLGLPLVVAGDGRALPELKRIAGPSIQFVGRLNDEQMVGYYRDAKALILPSEEDFGITSLEAMSAGRPVIAYRRGGALDTIVEGVTGIFFDEQTTESLVKALSNFDEQSYSTGAIAAHVAQYDNSVFRQRIRLFVEEEYVRFKDSINSDQPNPDFRIPTSDVVLDREVVQ